MASSFCRFETRESVLSDLRFAWIKPSCLRPMINVSDNSLHIAIYNAMDRTESHSIATCEIIVQLDFPDFTIHQTSYIITPSQHFLIAHVVY
jgi:hypothetical protein